MSHTITARNVNEALARGLQWLLLSGTEYPSRNGGTLGYADPIITTYLKPTERVLFSPLRDANPFFHLMESLWMLAGRNDLEFPKRFNSRFGEYSDDGVTVHGAYGFRWRQHFGADQLRLVERELLEHPDTRRAVLQMWDPRADLEKLSSGGRDVPCNTTAYFDLRGGALNMMVSNRSNDAIWGAYGANAVHFSVMQEYLAARLGVPVGKYHQVSNNLHIYLGVYPRERIKEIAENADALDLYSVLEPRPMVTAPGSFDDDLEQFLWTPDDYDLPVENAWFREVAVPVYRAWTSRSQEDLSRIDAPDWGLACREWVSRHPGKKASK